MRRSLALVLVAAVVLLSAPSAASGAGAPRRALRGEPAAPAPAARWAAWQRALRPPDLVQGAPAAPRASPPPAPAPAPASEDGVPDLILFDKPADTLAFLRALHGHASAEGFEELDQLAAVAAAAVQAAEQPPAAWRPVQAFLEGFGAAVKEAVTKLSPALGSLITFHDPEWVKVKGTSVTYHKHLAGVGATGIDVQPCLVRLGTAGAVVAPTLINIAPTGVSVGATGASVSPTLISIGPKLISVGPSAGAGMAAHLAFNPALISVTPTWDVLPAEAGVGPVLQPDPVKVDAAPGRLVVTPPVAPGAFAADRAAVQAAVRARAQPAP